MQKNLSKREVSRKDFRSGWCSNGLNGNHDHCRGHVGEIQCTCWCHPKEEEVAA